MASAATIEREKRIPVFIPLYSPVSFPEEALNVFASICFLCLCVKLQLKKYVFSILKFYLIVWFTREMLTSKEERPKRAAVVGFTRAKGPPRPLLLCQASSC